MYKGGFNMASYTQHYQLHQWEPNDNFLRTDFNTDLEKIDTALHATDTKVPSLTVGTYTGTGTFGDGSTCTLTFTFKPTIVIIFAPAQRNYEILCLPGEVGNAMPIGSSSGDYNYVTWQGNTVKWYSTTSEVQQFNQAGGKYYYLAV